MKPAVKSFLPSLSLTALLLFLAHSVAEAARIGEFVDATWTEQTARFFSLRDPAVRYAVLGSLLLGMSCGVLGSFLVVRRLALVGDMLSHAVLPGVTLGFLWQMTKDPKAILIGATAIGLLSTVVMSLIRQTTKLKEDSALAMVLAGFYAVGVVLYSVIQNLPTADKAGLDKFMFGQAAALSANDVLLISINAFIALMLLVLFYKSFLASSFDAAFASSVGIPTRSLHYLMMLLLSFAVVTALQAVGVVLVSALLIIPAATAYLLTDRMHRMLIYAAGFGMIAGFTGAFVSFLGKGLPTGPFMVLSAGGIFTLAFLFSPLHGFLPKYLQRQSRSRRTEVENTLKAVFQIRENEQFSREGVSLSALALRCNQPLHIVEKRSKHLVRQRMGTLHKITKGNPSMPHQLQLHLTPEGWKKACKIVRNHRLWELYLTEAAHYPSDHVHDDAEVIEHVLGEAIVQRLEKRLNYPISDPHGKKIPSDNF